MFILRNILSPLQQEFKHRRKGDERGVWFVYTLLAVITHFTSSRTSNLLRCLQTLLELPLSRRRFYTFMGPLPKIALVTLMGCNVVSDTKPNDKRTVTVGFG